MDIHARRDFLNGNELSGHIGTEKRTRVSYIEIWCECFGEDITSKRVNTQDIRLILNSIPGWNGSAVKQVKIKPYGNQRCIVYEPPCGSTL